MLNDDLNSTENVYEWSQEWAKEELELTPPALSPEKQSLLQDFTDFLVSAPESDIVSENTVDLFTLFRELAELRNEVKLESRQIKKTLDDYKELIGLLKSNNELLSHQLTQQQDLQLRTQEQRRKEYALELIEFCDYLKLALNNIHQLRTAGWLSKWSKANKFIERVLEGQKLSLSRFNVILKGLDVRPMIVIDQPFDPATMCVSEVCVRQDRLNGVVILELQTGYFIGKTVLRLANVMVNKLSEETRCE